MGWSYLGGKAWREVTRDERFFCQRLYSLAEADMARFVSILNRLSPGLALDESASWEMSFEVCFFRDMRHLLGAEWKPHYRYSPKRTFDLCLFSEQRVVVIEAKAQQSFQGDAEQLQAFADEPRQVAEVLGVRLEQVSLLMLAAEKYLTPGVRDALRDIAKTEPVSWAGLARAYADDPLLMRAEACYEPPVAGKNSEACKTGGELLALWQAGIRELMVGRQGGKYGAGLKQDLESGQWQTRTYESRAGSHPPNANWFPIADFIRVVAGERNGSS